MIEIKPQSQFRPRDVRDLKLLWRMNERALQDIARRRAAGYETMGEAFRDLTNTLIAQNALSEIEKRLAEHSQQVN